MHRELLIRRVTCPQDGDIQLWAITSPEFDVPDDEWEARAGISSEAYS